MTHRAMDGQLVVQLLGLVVAVIGGAVACGGPQGSNQVEIQGISPTPAEFENRASPDVYDADLLATSVGWALTAEGLRYSDDAGSTWSDATPRDVRGGPDLLAVDFADPVSGWAAGPGALGIADGPRTADEPVPVAVYTTADAGRAWSTSALEVPGNPGRLSLESVDASKGWLLIEEQTSSNFSIGQLWFSDDGGESWARREAPAGGELSFIDADTGWLVGGPARGAVYHTVDGGYTWAERHDVMVPGFEGRPVAYDPPRFFGESGVMPFTVSGEDQGAVGFLTTTDAGRSWIVAAVTPVPGPVEQGVMLPAAVTGAGEWIGVSSDGRRVYVAGDRGVEEPPESPTPQLSVGLPSALRLRFADVTHGWALASLPCAEVTVEDCEFRPRLFGTADGGGTWEALRP